MRKLSGSAMFMAAAALLLATAVAQNLNYTPDPNWKAPAREAARPNPLAQSPQAAKGGAKLFARECASCHGEDGSGLLSTAADLQLPVVQKQSDGTLFWKITNGNARRGMPSFSRLPQMQRWQLVLHIRAIVKAASAR